MAASSDLIPKAEPHDLTSGTGLLNDASNLWKDHQNGADALDYTFDGVSAGLDSFTTLVDPLGAALSGVVGFILEDIPGIRDLWNRLAGDPEAITQAALTWQNISHQLATSADTFATSAGQVESWSGDAADSFRQAAGDYEQILRGISGNTHDFSILITGVGCVVAALREVIYWLIAHWLEEDVIPEALAALGASWITFGGSLAAFLAWLTISTSVTMGVAGEKIAACCVKVAELYSKMGETISAAAKSAAATEEAAGGVSGAAEQASKVIDSPPVGATRAAGRTIEGRNKGEEGRSRDEQGGGEQGGGEQGGGEQGGGEQPQ